jgi:hypothetical protein
MSDLGRAVQTGGTTARADSGPSWLDSSWWAQLQPGSWRGVGFVMDAAENKAGRRTALHEYPYRDSVWVEDIGRLPRRFAFQAFLTGDDVYQQRDRMMRACEQAGPGTLVHPTLGTVQCVLLDFTSTDRRERGRLVELAFQFIVAGDIQLPAASTATGENVTAAAGRVLGATAADLSRTLIDKLGLPATPSSSTAVARAMPRTVMPAPATQSLAGFPALAVEAVNDPTRALNAVTGLPGLFGRYSAGRRGTMLPSSATVDSVLADSITTRQAVLDAAASLQTALQGL